MNKKVKETIQSIIFGTFIISLTPVIKYPLHLITKICHQEKLDLKNDILDDIVKAYNENEISKQHNPAIACGYFACAFETGSITIDSYTYTEDSLYDYNYESDYDCLLGKGVCRNVNLLFANLLTRAGFDVACITNIFDNGNGHLYVLIFDKELNQKYIYDQTNKCFWKFNNLNETVSVHRYSNNERKSEPYYLASLVNTMEFNYNDLFKLDTYENDVNFEKLYEDYLDGIRFFTHKDQELINNLTIDKKEKIKKLEQN